MTRGWDPDSPEVLRLPSGRLIRGRGLRKPPPPGPDPQFGLYCLGRQPAESPWESRWLRWPDFWLPADRDATREALVEALNRAENERVEIGCGGGVGRTGTAMACLAILDGIEPAKAVSYVRASYRHRAVETPWQRRFVRRFS